MRIVVAATGGVAALKTPSLLRRLREAGHEVRAAATDDAFAFITELSLAVAAGGDVFTRAAWFRPDGDARHLSWARWAELLVIAPATADALSSAATARSDDVVSALILGGVPRVLWVPAMNTAMWEHPLVRRNLETLRSIGHGVMEPDVGPLAARGEGSGVGRMPEPEEIVRRLPGLFGPHDLAGKKVLVSAGPTREYLDPVRYLSNPSSGKMGYAVAEAARDRGAAVTLVSGPVALAPPPGVDTVRVETAEAMLAALSENFDRCDVLVGLPGLRVVEVADTGGWLTVTVESPPGAQGCLRRAGPRVMAGARWCWSMRRASGGRCGCGGASGPGAAASRPARRARSPSKTTPWPARGAC